jgi:hypothetical protein
MAEKGCEGCEYAGKRASFHGESWTTCELLHKGVEFRDHEFKADELKGCPRHGDTPEKIEKRG